MWCQLFQRPDMLHGQHVDTVSTRGQHATDIVRHRLMTHSTTDKLMALAMTMHTATRHHQHAAHLAQSICADQLSSHPPPADHHPHQTSSDPRNLSVPFDTFDYIVRGISLKS